MNVLSWNRWTAVLALLGVFLAGALAGSAGTLKAVRRTVEERKDARTWAPKTLAWLKTEARLTPSQEATVTPAVRDAMKELEALRDQAETERREILRRMFFRIAGELSPPQVESLRAAIARAQSAESRSVPRSETPR